ncbi:hypothetical protein PM082_023021 [Marasmius tenuissimus]|nr:hypothetical protein PM082_023021 [Marasmius tenuissimus]
MLGLIADAKARVTGDIDRPALNRPGKDMFSLSDISRFEACFLVGVSCGTGQIEVHLMLEDGEYVTTPSFSPSDATCTTCSWIWSFCVHVGTVLY